jgi:hypothetical protein
MSAFKVEKVTSEDETKTFHRVISQSLSEHKLLATDGQKARYAMSVDFEKVDSTDIATTDINSVVVLSYTVHEIATKKLHVQDTITITRTVPNNTGKTTSEARAGMVAITLLTGGAGLAGVSGVESTAARQHRDLREKIVRDASKKLISRFSTEQVN